MGRSADWAIEVQMERQRELDLDSQYEQYEAEMKWFEEHPFLETYSIFTEKLQQLKLMVSRKSDPFDDQMLQKMTYVHGVTLFEAMVGERPGPSMYWAHASWDPDGWPAITYGPTYF